MPAFARLSLIDIHCQFFYLHSLTLVTTAATVLIQCHRQRLVNEDYLEDKKESGRTVLLSIVYYSNAE